MKTRFLTTPAKFTLACLVAAAVFVIVRQDQSTAIAEEKADVVPGNTGKSTFSPYVDREGNISLPKNYKQSWSHLGGWAVAKKRGESIHEMHSVYTQPETTTAFQQNGEFPDGAVLVKEVRHAKSDRLTTGHSAWASDVKIWFVMIKDRKDRFSENDHWGDGWGWALFEAKAPDKNVSAGYDTSCIACHVPAEESDWVYVYGYPALTKSK